MLNPITSYRLELKNSLDISPVFFFFSTRLDGSLMKNGSVMGANFSFLGRVSYTDWTSERQSQTSGQHSKYLSLDSFSTLL